MKTRNIILPLLATGLMISGLIAGGPVFAGDDDRGGRGGRHEGHERGERRGEGALTATDNPLYKQECSSCHFLYQPGLLPARSWQAIMKNSDKHFGENLALDEKTSKTLLSYLTANSAEKGGNEWSRKILESAGSGTPTRITETPYIAKKHRRISPEIFKRPSIGSFSNCGGCHTRALEGDFEEDAVSIPKK